MLTAVTFHEPRLLTCLSCGHLLTEQQASTIGSAPINLSDVIHVQCDRCEVNLLAMLTKRPMPSVTISMTDLLKDDFQNLSGEAVSEDDVLDIHKFLFQIP